jgi:hypothetical protein
MASSRAAGFSAAGSFPCGGLRLAGELALLIAGDVSPGVVAGDVVDGLVGFRVVRA